MNLVIAGPQGSGKGTQAELLAKKFGLVHIESGKILREEMAAKTPLGLGIAQRMNEGRLIPDQIITQILKRYLTPKLVKRGIIFDGSPRSLGQAQWLDRQMAGQGAEINYLILLKVSEKESIRRLSSRRNCPKCNRIYNLITKPPAKDGVCDDCHIPLAVREDETPEAIKKRLEEYRRQTTPVIDYYRQKNKVIEINGEQPIETIHQEIIRRLRRCH